MDKQQRLDELADFLRTRPTRLRPEDIDFPAGQPQENPRAACEEGSRSARASASPGTHGSNRGAEVRIFQDCRKPLRTR